MHTAVAAVEKPVPYISSPGVKMFHPAQQHSYIAHIYERHVLMKTVIELLYYILYTETQVPG
jgi:hypothetical protein